MDRGNGQDQTGLYRLLGELSADMKHVLRSLESTRSATTKLRDEMRTENNALNDRLSRVEKFNTKVLTYATVVVTIGVPVVVSVIKWGVPALLALV